MAGWQWIIFAGVLLAGGCEGVSTLGKAVRDLWDERDHGVHAVGVLGRITLEVKVHDATGQGDGAEGLSVRDIFFNGRFRISDLIAKICR